MLIEAADRAITYRWPGGDIRLEPGKPVEVEESRALKNLAKTDGKVRVANQEWLKLWREIAALTSGVSKDDPLFDAITAAVERADRAFLRGDLKALTQEVEHIAQSRALGREGER